MDTAGSHGEDRDGGAKWRTTGLGRSICPHHLRDASLHPKQMSDSGISLLCGLSQAPSHVSPRLQHREGNNTGTLSQGRHEDSIEQRCKTLGILPKTCSSQVIKANFLLILESMNFICLFIVHSLCRIEILGATGFTAAHGFIFLYLVQKLLNM